MVYRRNTTEAGAEEHVFSVSRFVFRGKCARLRKNLSRLSGFIFLLSAFAGLRAVNVPAYIEADELAPVNVQAMMEQANRAMSNQSWTEAEMLLEKALSESGQENQTVIRERLAWCRANVSVERRYRENDLAEYIQKTSVLDGFVLLRETLKLINEKYYSVEEVSFREIVDRSLMELIAATQNEAVYGQYDVDRSQLKRFHELMMVERRCLDPCDYDDPGSLYAMMQSWSRSGSQTGFGASWPAMELAFAMAANCDRYSYLMKPADYDDLLEQIGGFYVGTGMELLFTQTYPVVFDVVAASPADEAGVRPGDVLFRIDHAGCKGLCSTEIGAKLRGPAYSTVTITVLRDGETKECDLKRRMITSPSVRYVKMAGADTGYFRVASFDDDTVWEMNQAVQSLQKKGAKGLIIDLRGNGGGVMISAIDAVRLFIDEGPIVTVCSKGEQTVYKAGGNQFSTYNLPLVVLVDRHTASAAEIFTAAIKDHRRGVIVGENTFGKDLVQTIYGIRSTSSALCITTAQYLPPSMVSFHGAGIQPDIRIGSVENNSEKIIYSMKDLLAEDNQTLRKAIDILRSL